MGVFEALEQQGIDPAQHAPRTPSEAQQAQQQQQSQQQQQQSQPARPGPSMSTTIGGERVEMSMTREDLELWLDILTVALLAYIAIKI